MLSKACKSVIVIVCLFFFINFDVSAQGMIVEDMGRQSQEGGAINISLVEKNTDQLVVITLFDENGKLIDAVKLNNNFSTNYKWKVKSGSYRIHFENLKTGEKEIHYVII